MNEVVNKFLLAGGKFMPEMYLKQARFTYSACESFTKNKERIQKIKETGGTNYIYKNELDKACFQHGMAYGGFKDLARKTTSDKYLRDKAFNITNNPKYDGHQRRLAFMVSKFFDNKSAGSGVTNDEVKQNLQLAEELHKPIIRKFKETVYSEFKDNIWGADLADMQLINKLHKGFNFLLCVIDSFRKYAWIVPLKDKNGVSIVMHFKRF